MAYRGAGRPETGRCWQCVRSTATKPTSSCSSRIPGPSSRVPTTMTDASADSANWPSALAGSPESGRKDPRIPVQGAVQTLQDAGTCGFSGVDWLNACSETIQDKSSFVKSAPKRPGPSCAQSEVTAKTT
jgi:hypothetical protein